MKKHKFIPHINFENTTDALFLNPLAWEGSEEVLLEDPHAFVNDFLCSAKKLIEKEGPDSQQLSKAEVVSLIESLQDQAKENDNCQLIAQVLHMAVIVARSGVLSRLVEAGRIHETLNLTSAKVGGKESGKSRRTRATTDQAEWQAEADRIWLVNPKLSSNQTAIRIADKLGANPDTVRKSIKRPLP